jgi:hypothetical protein
MNNWKLYLCMRWFVIVEFNLSCIYTGWSWRPLEGLILSIGDFKYVRWWITRAFFLPRLSVCLIWSFLQLSLTCFWIKDTFGRVYSLHWVLRVALIGSACCLCSASHLMFDSSSKFKLWLNKYWSRCFSCYGSTASCRLCFSILSVRQACHALNQDSRS